MKLSSLQKTHLTYCMNVHPGEHASDIMGHLQEYVVPLKNRISADKAFGLGLRLSYQSCVEFEETAILESFHELCQNKNLYVMTVNGFIYGDFHGKRIKEQVYEPDWSHPARLEYTNRLAHVLSKMPLDSESREASISTVPVGFASEISHSEKHWKAGEHLVQHAMELHRIFQETGVMLRLGLEPEPGCYLENIEDVLGYFEQVLLHQSQITKWKQCFGQTASVAEENLRQHLGICYDTCHMAIAYEPADNAWQRLKQHEIRVVKTQLSSALSLGKHLPYREKVQYLKDFDETTYLHQVVRRSESGHMIKHNDLSEAFAQSEMHGPETWRVHFHVPIFKETLGTLETTQSHLLSILSQMTQYQDCPHLEVETYTWNVLPASWRQASLIDAIYDELLWVRKQLGEV